MDLNLLERGMALLSPSWGIKRLHAKAGLEQSRIHARAFDAGRRDRRTEGWRATGGSANNELAPSLSLIRNRSRDLCRNNEWAINAKRKWQAHLVGAGIVPRPFGVKGRAKERARDAWNAFSDSCDPEGLTDFYGIQARLTGEAFEGGAAFLRWYPRPSSLNLKIPLQCEVLEHDYLDIHKTEVLSSGNVVIHGVEYDAFGRRAAYWLFPNHPGEFNLVRRPTMTSQRVSSEWCNHVFRVDRPGQVTGVPWTAPTMLRMRDTADYEEAELVRKKIEACFTAFVQRGTSAQGLAQSADQKTDGKDRRIEKISPGLIVYHDGEGDVKFAAPNASTDGGHMERQQYAFAAGIGLPFASATGNFSKVNFSSMRAAVLDFWPVLDQLQWHMIAPQICRPAWQRVMAAAAGRGIQVSPYTQAKHGMPKRPWVNPNDDLRATAGELALGITSWADVVSERGYDPDDLLKEIAEWLPQLKAAGLNPGAAPGLAGMNQTAEQLADADKKTGKPADVTQEGNDDEQD